MFFPIRLKKLARIQPFTAVKIKNSTSHCLSVQMTLPPLGLIEPLQRTLGDAGLHRPDPYPAAGHLRCQGPRP